MTPTILYGAASGNPVDPNADPSGSGSLPGIGNTSAAPTTRQAAAAAPAAGGAGAGGAGATAAATAGDTDWSDIYGSSNYPLSEMFTTVGRERNVAADGTPQSQYQHGILAGSAG